MNLSNNSTRLFIPGENLHIVFGSVITISALLGLIPNIIFIKMVVSNKQYFVLTSFRLMTMLSTINIIALISIAISGMFTFFESTGNYLINKIVSAFGLPCYPAYAVTSAILSLHCLLLLSRPNLNARLFSLKNKWWFFVILFIYSFFFIAFALNEVEFSVDDWFWVYYTDKKLTIYVERIQEITEDSSLISSGIIYILFIKSLVKMRKLSKTSSHNYTREFKVFIQTLIITTYSIIFNILWYHSGSVIPLTPPVLATINFLWLINHTLDPIIYLIVNKVIKTKDPTIHKVFVLKPKPSMNLNSQVITKFMQHSRA